MEKKRREILLILLLMLIIIVCFPVWADEGSDDNTGGAITTAQDLNGKRIGVQTGTTFDAIVKEALPEAQISYFNAYSDMVAAIEANKIDAFPGDEPVLRLMAAENNKLMLLDDRLDSFEFGFVMAKTENGGKLRDEIRFPERKKRG